jgi:hypothetical protein
MAMRKRTNNGGGFKWEYRDCIDCGKKFIAKNYNSVRCFECQAIHKAQTEREKRQRRRDEKNSKNNSLYICKKIKHCAYGGKMGAEHICDFLNKKGYKRPCPAGACTEYKRKGRRTGGNDGMQI